MDSADVVRGNIFAPAQKLRQFVASSKKSLLTKFTQAAFFPNNTA